MIGQNSNNKATGYTAKECDAGIPISGRTGDTGTYEIIKVNADGSLAVNTGPTPITGLGTGNIGVGGFLTNVFNTQQPQYTYLGYGYITPTAITAGLYRITVGYNIAATAPAGGINFLLVNDASPVAGSLGMLFPGNILSFNLNAPGIYGQWVNVLSNQLNGQIRTSVTSANHTQDIYLDAGLYQMHVVANAAINFTANSGYYGLYEFSKLA